MPKPITGQAVGVGLSTPVALSATPVSCVAFSLKAPLSNAAAIYLGPATVTSATGYQFDPGDEISYQTINQAGQPIFQMQPSDFYMVGTGPDKVVWLALP
jgi:hypothetical protein